MVGFSNNGDAMVIIGMVILSPLLLVLGIPLVLSSLGSPAPVVILAFILNVALVVYLMKRWQVVDYIKETFGVSQR